MTDFLIYVLSDQGVAYANFVKCRSDSEYDCHILLDMPIDWSEYNLQSEDNIQFPLPSNFQLAWEPIHVLINRNRSGVYFLYTTVMSFYLVD